MSVFVLKPDGIGDFVLACGAIRRLADEYGEDRLVLAVLPAVASLAAMQFPRATVVDLRLLTRRRRLNLFLANVLRVAPLWAGPMGRRFDAAISLRHARPYLHSFLLASLRARRHVVTTNQLAAHGEATRSTVEALLWRLRRVTPLPYPEEPAPAPLELEAHRRVVEAAIGRPVTRPEVLPVLHATPHGGTDILLCPASSKHAKDFPAERWAEVFRDLPPAWRSRSILVAGGPGQEPALKEVQNALRLGGFAAATSGIPASLPDFTNTVAGAALVLTVDTAAAHIACALDRPCVILFSGTHRRIYAPWTSSDRQVWIEPAPGAPVPTKKRDWHLGIDRETVTAEIRSRGG
jgi:ADP-heptose:LPS heptosyltransferase